MGIGYQILTLSKSRHQKFLFNEWFTVCTVENLTLLDPDSEFIVTSKDTIVINGTITLRTTTRDTELYMYNFGALIYLSRL